VTEPLWEPDVLGRSLAGLLVLPPRLDLRHISVMRGSVTERVAHLRALLRSAVAVRFDDVVRDADRITVARTLWALLALHKRGEASWDQVEPFGEITVRRLTRASTDAPGEERRA